MIIEMAGLGGQFQLVENLINILIEQATRRKRSSEGVGRAESLTQSNS